MPAQPSEKRPNPSDRGPYHLTGAARDLFACQLPEVLLSGPAGTGKSLACLLKLHFLCEHVPGLRCLIFRKTRESLTESALVTFEEKVLPANHPAVANGGQRRVRQAYHYPNGSTIVIGGMDKPGKIMSTEYDFAYAQEAIEMTEDDWESVTTRLRNNRLPYQQLIADTNPDRPTHWLKRRCDARRTLLLESRHEDNPLLWQAGAWTAFARKPDGVTGYIDRLENLTGPRKQRLRFGRWVQSEGVVYDGWDAAVHLVPRDTLKWTRTDLERYLVIDFGYTNPFVCQWWVKDHDGRLYRYRELYQTNLLVEDAARQIRELSKGEPSPRAVICDHDAEGRATLERYLGWRTTPAEKTVLPGIEAVAKRLRKAGDGKPRLHLLRDSLVRRDPALVEAKLPCCTEEEIDGYVWRDDGKEEPVKENDHGCDCLRYAVAYHDLGVSRTAAPKSLGGGVVMPGR